MGNLSVQNNKSHITTEEAEWRKILSMGNEKTSMILLHSQKLCAVAHEIEAAMGNNRIAKNDLTYFAKRLTGRINSVLQLLNNYEKKFNVESKFAELSTKFETLKDINESYETMKKLILEIHSLTHQLSDELLKK